MVRDTQTPKIIHQDHQHGIVQAIDVMQFLSPTSLSLGVLSYTLGVSFPSHHASVVLVDQVVMEAIYAGRWIDIYHDSTKFGHIPLHAPLQTPWTKELIVFVFLQGSHFTANALQYSRIQTADGLLINGRIHHLDSFLNTNQTQLDSTMSFLSHSAVHQYLPVNWSS